MNFHLELCNVLLCFVSYIHEGENVIQKKNYNNNQKKLHSKGGKGKVIKKIHIRISNKKLQF